MQKAASKINKCDTVSSAMTKTRVKFQICWSLKLQRCGRNNHPEGVELAVLKNVTVIKSIKDTGDI